MVKPALPYLDIISLIKREFPYMPLAAYNVSGEYLMVESASREGWVDRDKIILEILYSIKRAGADLIITYHSTQAAKLIGKGYIPF
jgi:porphobilinogen synthase